jgi:hypothetical protein
VAVTAAPAFKDHFSGQSQAYRRYRPEYPLELFDWLAAIAPARELAVDVATGVARPLSRWPPASGA